MQGYFIISRPWEKHWYLRIFAALSFPFPRFNLKTLNVNDHLQVTWLIFQQWICHIIVILKATELKLFAKFNDDWSKQSISNATSPNYANYEVTHALTYLSIKLRARQGKRGQPHLSNSLLSSFSAPDCLREYTASASEVLRESHF